MLGLRGAGRGLLTMVKKEVVVVAFVVVVVMMGTAAVVSFVVGVFCGCAHLRVVTVLWSLHWKRPTLSMVSLKWGCLAVSGR